MKINKIIKIIGSTVKDPNTLLGVGVGVVVAGTYELIHRVVRPEFTNVIQYYDQDGSPAFYIRNSKKYVSKDYEKPRIRISRFKYVKGRALNNEHI